MNMSIFRRSRVVVVSQSNRNCDIGFSHVLIHVAQLNCYRFTHVSDWLLRSRSIRIKTATLSLHLTH